MKILFSEDKIKKRVIELASEIANNYGKKELILISVLNGSFIFSSDLIRALHKFNVNPRIYFIRAKSYLNDKTSGKVDIYDRIPDLRDKNVLIVEDIFDTGLTLFKLYERFIKCLPLSLEVAVLLYKRKEQDFNVPIKYIGFEIEDKFVVGYGLDYNEQFRGCPYIAYI